MCGCAYSLTRAQTEFIGTQPAKAGHHKKSSGIFTRQSSHAGHKGYHHSAINKLDARNDKAMNAHGNTSLPHSFNLYLTVTI